MNKLFKDLFRKQQRYIAMYAGIPTKQEDAARIRCCRCGEILYIRDMEKNVQVCRKCVHYFQLTASDRLTITLDEGSFKEIDADMKTFDPISFPEYEEKLESGSATASNDAILIGEGAILGWPILVGAFEPYLITEGMGDMIGEKITRLVDAAIERKLPMLLFLSSGGTLIQEGAFSLMQMAETSAAIAMLNEAGLLYISVLTDPATGGAASSIAALGDVIIAEPGTLIGLAGRRVAKLTLKEELPSDFQTAEFCLKHGYIDIVVPRQEMRAVFAQIISLHSD